MCLHRVPARQAEAVGRRRVQRDPGQSQVKGIHGSGRSGQVLKARLPQRPDLLREPELQPYPAKGRTVQVDPQIIHSHDSLITRSYMRLRCRSSDRSYRPCSDQSRRIGSSTTPTVGPVSSSSESGMVYGRPSSYKILGRAMRPLSLTLGAGPTWLHSPRTSSASLGWVGWAVMPAEPLDNSGADCGRQRCPPGHRVHRDASRAVSTYSNEVPDECVASVLQIREFLTTVIGDGGIAEQLREPVRLMRRYCVRFLERVGANEFHADPAASSRHLFPGAALGYA